MGQDKDIFMMSRKEVKRYQVIRKVLDKQIKQREVAEYFGLSPRQVRRVELIFAHSPQAKGRVERVFRTLQDRLTKELRLSQASSLQEANYLLNCYLPVFNKKFGVPSRGVGDFHRVLDKNVRIDEILSVQTERFLRNDRTVLHHKRWYQVLDKTRAKRVVVCEYLDGQMAIKYGKDRLQFKAIEGPVARPEKPLRRFKAHGCKLPAKKHPWRDGFKIPEVHLTKRGHF